MKERGILFNAPMVRAILDDRKTQTRRVCKLQPHEAAGMTWWPDGHGTDTGTLGGAPGCYLKLSPYGQPGDRLWVRETFAIVPRTAYARSEGVQQTLRPDDPYDHDAAIYREGWCRSNGGFRWRPSIHMPRWASRILLEVVSVRVERLNDISEADARAEGVPAHDTARAAYANLWNDINGAGSWDTNPWVWVIDFELVKP